MAPVVLRFIPLNAALARRRATLFSLPFVDHKGLCRPSTSGEKLI